MPAQPLGWAGVPKEVWITAQSLTSIPSTTSAGAHIPRRQAAVSAAQSPQPRPAARAAGPARPCRTSLRSARSRLGSRRRVPAPVALSPPHQPPQISSDAFARLARAGAARRGATAPVHAADCQERDRADRNDVRHGRAGPAARAAGRGCGRFAPPTPAAGRARGS